MVSTPAASFHFDSCCPRRLFPTKPFMTLLAKSASRPVGVVARWTDLAVGQGFCADPSMLDRISAGVDIPVDKMAQIFVSS
jgi:hypothetical protein